MDIDVPALTLVLGFFVWVFGVQVANEMQKLMQLLPQFASRFV